MRSFRLAALLLVLLHLTALTAALSCAAPGSSAEATATRAKDARLKQRVTSRAVDLPLRTWIEQLSRQTGVSLRTSPDVEDRAVTVRVAGMSLGDLMKGVTALFGDFWLARGKKEAPAYVLEPSLARRSRQRRYLETYYRTLQDALTDEARTVAEKGPPASYLPAPSAGSEEDRARYAAELKARARLVSLLPPGMMQRLLQGERLRVRVAEAQGPFGEAARSFIETFAMPTAGGGTEQQRAGAWLEFSSQPYMLSESAPALPLRDLYWAVGSDGKSSAYNVVAKPEEFVARLSAALAPLRHEEEQDLGKRRRQESAAMDRVLPEKMKPAPGTRVSRSELLIAIADAADLNLISDSYTKPRVAAPPLAGRTVADAMAAVGALHACDWRSERGTLLVRSRYWWLDDRDEPPATAAARWQAALEEQGVLSLDEACRIAALSREQQQRLALRIPEARSAFNIWLRLYGQLDPGQRQAAETSSGLPLANVPAAARLLVTTSDPQNNSYFGNRRLEQALMEGPATLKVTREAAGNRPALTVLVEPLPGAAGRRQGQRQRVTVLLPQRDRRVQRAPFGSAGGAPPGPPDPDVLR